MQTFRRRKAGYPGTVRGDSLRGIVLSYIISEPGLETINTITQDLTIDDDGGKKYRAIIGAVDSLEQRGFIHLGDGPNKSNTVLWPNQTVSQESGIFECHSNGNRCSRTS